jgi:hypothetical protein
MDLSLSSFSNSKAMGTALKALFSMLPIKLKMIQIVAKVI